MARSRLAVALFAVLLWAGVSAPLAVGAPAAGAVRGVTVVTWSDIHYGNEDYAADAWRQAYREGRALRSDVYVVSGDLTDNKCSREAFTARLDAFLPAFRAQLDALNAPVILALGNNDIAINYQTDPEALALTLSAWRKRLGPHVYLDALGNGVHPRAVRGMTWITVNSQIFSRLNEYDGREAQARATFAWLSSALRRVPRAQTAVLVMHIPPTSDFFDGKASWNEADLRRLSDVIDAHAGKLIILAAHYHRNEIHALTTRRGKTVPVLLAGSVSCKYDSRPNWRSSVWQLGADGTVRRFDWINRYPGHPEWSESWVLPSPFSATTYAALVTRLRQDLAFYLRYAENLCAHNPEWEQWCGGAEKREKLAALVRCMLFPAQDSDTSSPALGNHR
ncbi:MAG: metallophosphoesterase [Proteobacteria bacterium]|nr:metallophosphoesterase [Pseudomonadota bacterium]